MAAQAQASSTGEFPYLRRLSRLHLCNDWLSPFFLQ
jgi:hypothetical protein